MDKQDPGRRQFLAGSLALGTASLLPARAIAADAPQAAPAAAPAPTTGGGRLTFHAIDTHHGATSGTLRVELRRFEGDRYQPVQTFDTVKNGRSDGAVIEGEALKPGLYEAVLHVDDYFAALGTKLPTPTFLSRVPLRFGVHDPSQRYHLAVLFNPWSYSYYRGS
jgi:5-hydroxyisourate hydrolase